MDRRDVEIVVNNLQRKPFICGNNEIIVSGGYVIIKREEYEELKKNAYEWGRKK